MLTVPEAADRAGRNAETIRRWIRSGRLRARKVGTQHVIEESDLDAALEDRFLAPERWTTTFTGERMPNWPALLREDRAAH
jgi:excisionase family DNA binding protein